MQDLIQIGAQPVRTYPGAAVPGKFSASVAWLQGITLAWMLVECAISLVASAAACSPALLAFGADSAVELASATVVLLQFLPRFPLSQQRANRTTGVLLFVLAGVVAIIAVLALVMHYRPGISRLGMGITVAALIAMPALAWLKRREAIRGHNPALAADAVQSATCAYLAATTLAGLAANALFHIPWLDSLAALLAVPLLVSESKKAWHGKACGCC